MCLEDLIGLTKDEVSCFTDNAPAKAHDSVTGYYLDDPDYGIRLDKCSIAGYGILAKAKEQAIRELQDDLVAALRNKYSANLHKWAGIVGKHETSGYSTTSTFNGHRISFESQKGLYLRFKKIALMSLVSATGVAGKIYSSRGELMQELTVNVGSDIWAQNEVNFRLPLFTDDGSDLHYDLIIESGTPASNSIVCCGNSKEFESWIDIQGMAYLSASNTEGIAQEGGRGMRLSMSIECDSLGWICELENMGEYNLRNVLGRCQQWRGAAIAIADVLTKNHINICTLYNREEFEAKRDFYNKRYGETVAWIVENLPEGFSSCWSCNDNIYYTQTLLS